MVDLKGVKRRLDKIAAAAPALPSADDTATRIARALAAIEGTPPPLRSFLIDMYVSTSSNRDEPGEYSALLAAIGPQRLSEAYGDAGPPAYSGIDPVLRRHAREWHGPEDRVNPLDELLDNMIARKK